MFPFAFLFLLALAVLLGKWPMGVLVIYVAMSAVTYTVYMHDKRAARRHAWRVPESALHVLALLGGWPGALLAQGRLRHKIAKRGFRVVSWGMVVFNGAALGWLVSPAGLRVLHAIHVG